MISALHNPWIIVAIGCVCCALIGPVAGMVGYFSRYERKEKEES